MAVCIIPNLLKMFNKNITILIKKLAANLHELHEFFRSGLGTDTKRKTQDPRQSLEIWHQHLGCRNRLIVSYGLLCGGRGDCLTSPRAVLYCLGGQKNQKRCEKLRKYTVLSHKNGWKV